MTDRKPRQWSFEKVKRLRRENAELIPASQILKMVSAFFAAKIDRGA